MLSLSKYQASNAAWFWILFSCTIWGGTVFALPNEAANRGVTNFAQFVSRDEIAVKVGALGEEGLFDHPGCCFLCPGC